MNKHTRLKTHMWFLLLILGVASATEFPQGLTTVRGEWQGGLAGWKVAGDKPHHLIVWEVGSDKRFAFVWGGGQEEMYPSGTAFVPRPDTHWELEVHNHNPEPIHIETTPVWTISWKKEVEILGSAVTKGVVLPGESVTTPTFEASKVLRIRMHSHHAVRQTFTLDGKIVADTGFGHLVNKWLDVSGSGSFNSTCWYPVRSGVGITKCIGCRHEMCTAYVLVKTS